MSSYRLIIKENNTKFKIIFILNFNKSKVPNPKFKQNSIKIRINYIRNLKKIF